MKGPVTYTNGELEVGRAEPFTSSTTTEHPCRAAGDRIPPRPPKRPGRVSYSIGYGRPSRREQLLAAAIALSAIYAGMLAGAIAIHILRRRRP